MKTKTYLGDSVYCEFDGYGYVLTTENGIEASNTIHIDDEVLESFMMFVQRIEMRRLNTTETTKGEEK